MMHHGQTSKKRKLSKKCKLNKNSGNLKILWKYGIYKFCKNRGMCNMHHWLMGDGRPCSEALPVHKATKKTIVLRKQRMRRGYQLESESK